MLRMWYKNSKSTLEDSCVHLFTKLFQMRSSNIYYASAIFAISVNCPD